MGNSILQASLNGGELAPALYGRVDLARYANSLKTCRNMIAAQTGGVKNRAGLRYVATAKDSTKRVRLIPFEFNTLQTYILEFGHLTMRVYRNGGQVETSPGVPFEVATPYTDTQLAKLNWTQSADVLTVVHPSHAPRQISRTGDAAWTVTEFANKNGPFRDVNVNKGITVYASAVTGNVTLTASAALFTADMVGTLFYLEQKDFSFVKPWESYTQIVGENENPLGQRRRSDGKNYICTTDVLVPTGGKDARTGTIRPTHAEGAATDGTGQAITNVSFRAGLEWTFTDPGHGYVKITGFTSATSVTATVASDWQLPQSLITAAGASYKWAKSAWGGDQGFPAAVGYYQNRQVFGGMPGAPANFNMSKVGNFFDFGNETPIVADDAIAAPLPGRQVNAIRHIIPLDKMALLTSGSEWVIGAGQDDVVTPQTINLKVQGYRGCSSTPPLIVGNTCLFIQDKGQTIRELAFDFTSDTYTGNDLTQLAAHLFAGHQITEWAYQQVPFQCAWAVRSDGVLLSMTYLKEQQVIGWCRHDTDGFFESVAVISEGTEDVLYAVVRRTVNGATKRYIERMNTRSFATQKDAFFVDAGLTYDGRNTGTTTMTIAASGGDWSYQTGVFTVSASVAVFAAGDVGTEVHFPVGSQVLRLIITSVTSNQVVTVQANRDIAESLRNVPTTNWGIARKSFAGLSHLEAKTCSVLADGHVHAQVTVSGGAIALQYAATVVHVGLPITADIETLSISLPNAETVLDKKKLIHAVRILVEDSRGIFAGPDAAHLVEIKQRAAENYDQPANLLTGIAELRIPATWSKDGRVFLRQSDPLPLSVLSIIPELTTGGV